LLELLEMVHGKKQGRERIVLAFGTFDLLHEGHLFFLKRARGLGSKLIVVVARDKSVERVKGRLPVDNEETRLKRVGELPFVDSAVLGNEYSKRYEILGKIKPCVIALGYDQKPSERELLEALAATGVNAEIVRLEAFNAHRFKSSRIRESLA
jgi:FAD synthetase